MRTGGQGAVPCLTSRGWEDEAKGAPRWAGARFLLARARHRKRKRKKARGCPLSASLAAPAYTPLRPYLDLRQLQLALQRLEAGVQVAAAGRRVVGVGVVRGRRRHAWPVEVHPVLGGEGAFDLHGARWVAEGAVCVCVCGGWGLVDETESGQHARTGGGALSLLNGRSGGEARCFSHTQAAFFFSPPPGARPRPWRPSRRRPRPSLPLQTPLPPSPTSRTSRACCELF